VRARLIGVGVTDLTDEPWTLDLFEGGKVEQLERLARTLDGIRERYGFSAILRGKSWESQHGNAAEEA